VGQFQPRSRSLMDARSSNAFHAFAGRRGIRSVSAPRLTMALERLWVRRAEVEKIGQLAAKRIRQLIPADPIEIFAGMLTQLTRQRKPVDERSLDVIERCRV
jgi:hypothetical protein